MALTTQTQVEQRLQWDITAEPETVITTLIAAAQAHIEAEVGRALESDDHTEAYDGTPGSLICLRHWPVTAIGSVTEDGTALTASDYQFYDDGRLIRVASGYRTNWRTTKPQSIAVAYTGGYLAGTHDLDLAHLGSICTEVVARAFRQGAASAAQPAGVGLGGITQVSLDGSDTVQFSNPSSVVIELGGGLSRFVFLLESEAAQLARYKPVFIG